MKKWSFLLCLCLSGVVLFAQEKNLFVPGYKVTGQAVESKSGKGIPYVTITMQKSDSLQDVIRLCSDVSGKFTVNLKTEGKHTLTLSAVGYKRTLWNFETGNNPVIEIGIIQMEEGVDLQEISVTAQKPLIKIDVDKLTYSIENDPDSKTNNALEMLRKVPMITVDGEDNVTLNGQSNFKVLVNGKSSSMMSQNFKDVIRSLPASSIKEIEVITSPSSKYEAEGVGGIINIITVRKMLSGYNGSLNAGYDNFGAISGSVYVSSKINKLGLSGRYSINQYKRPPSRNNLYRESYLASSEKQKYTNSLSTYEGSGVFHNFNGEASYDIDSLNLISMSFWGFQGSNNSQGKSVMEILDSQHARTSYFEMLSGGDYGFGVISGNIDYQKTFKKPDKTFTVSYRLENNSTTSDNISETQNTINYEDYKQHIIRDDFTREQTLQIDYYDPLTKKHQIECGLKGIYRQNEGNSDVFRLNMLTGEMEKDNGRSNELVYDQTIVGMYGGYVFNPGKFSLKTGLRVELTWNSAVSKSERDTSFFNSLKNVVPYLTLNYKLKPTETMKLSYTQRLQRPGIWYLNPYRNDMNRLYVYYGNPNLKSEVSHSFELSYSNFTPKFNFNLTSRTLFSNNSIEQIVFMDNLNVQHTTYDNIGSNFQTGLSTYLSYRPNGKININLNGGITYTRKEAMSMGRIQQNDGFNYRISPNGRLTLWKDASLSFSGGYYSPSVRLQGKSSGYIYSSAGISQYFLKKKITLNFSVNNPFMKELIYTNKYLTDEFKSVSEYIQIARSFRVSLSFNFGKMETNVKKVKRGIQNDDLKSGGEGDGTGAR